VVDIFLIIFFSERIGHRLNSELGQFGVL